MVDTGAIAEYDDSYALRLIEQGKAVYVDGDTPIPPEPEPIDPSQYGELIEALQNRCAELETAVSAIQQEAADDRAFAGMYQSIFQAQERQLEYLEEHLQEEIDAAAGVEEG